jgi:hypothetical protein
MLLLAVFLSGSTLFAQQSPKTMIRMEVILQSADAPEGSFAAQPKVMYRAGHQYCRIEEALDATQGIHGVVIINEPDFWMVNLVDQSARHAVDPGPNFSCRMPIFPGVASKLPDDQKQELMGLEFGYEMQFFKDNGAVAKPGPVLQTKQTTAYRLDVGDISLGLFTYGPPERPLGIAWTRGDEHAIIWYSGYGELDFDQKLFAKPEHVKIEDAKPSDQGLGL